MGTYDFYGQLEPMEFQRFARDIIQAREGIHLESFAETGDGASTADGAGKRTGPSSYFRRSGSGTVCWLPPGVRRRSFQGLHA